MTRTSDEDLFGDLDDELNPVSAPVAPPAPVDPDELVYSLDRPPARLCPQCRGKLGTRVGLKHGEPICLVCDDVRYIGIDPSVATCLMPWHPAKTSVVAARYRAGLSFFRRDDAKEPESDYVLNE